MDENQNNKGVGVFPYVLAGLAYIPAFGIFFGLIAILLGLVSKKKDGKKVVLIALGGILVTFILYGSLFYFGFVQRGGVYDDLRAKMAKSMINQLVQTIEFYKIQNGHYPETMEILRQSLPKDSMVFMNDPTDMTLKKPRYYYYQLIDPGHYYLLGVGKDGQPFTADDLLPEVESKAGNLGLLLKK